jgi:hypothetical protein
VALLPGVVVAKGVLQPCRHRYATNERERMRGMSSAAAAASSLGQRAALEEGGKACTLVGPLDLHDFGLRAGGCSSTEGAKGDSEMQAA